MRNTALLMLVLFLALPVTGLAKARQRVSRKSPPLTGTYVQSGRKGAGGTLLVRRIDPNRIELDLECSRGAPSYNSGVAHATVEVLEGIAVYRVTEFNGPCELKFDFRGSSVVVSQTGEDFACGFGHGVNCSGSYRLKSRKPPKFKKRD